jgi:hypothetical protein
MATTDESGATHYGIVEVYYNDDSTIYGHTGPIEVTGESVRDLRWTLAQMLRCLRAPVLVESEFECVSYDDCDDEDWGPLDIEDMLSGEDDDDD